MTNDLLLLVGLQFVPTHTPPKSPWLRVKADLLFLTEQSIKKNEICDWNRQGSNMHLKCICQSVNCPEVGKWMTWYSGHSFTHPLCFIGYFVTVFCWGENLFVCSPVCSQRQWHLLYISVCISQSRRPFWDEDQCRGCVTQHLHQALSSSAPSKTTFTFM